VKITTLIENTPSGNRVALKAEHGLSLHIAFGNASLLFDIGASAAFSENAEALGIDLKNVDAVVLSHHHYDHGGGLKRFLSLNQRANIYLKRPPDGELYFKSPILPKRYVGLESDVLQACTERYIFVDRLTEILPDVFIITDIGATHPKPQGNKNLHIKRQNGWTPDIFSHELVMVIRENDEIVLFTGCAHNGVLNMISAVEPRSADRPSRRSSSAST